MMVIKVLYNKRYCTCQGCNHNSIASRKSGTSPYYSKARRKVWRHGLFWQERVVSFLQPGRLGLVCPAGITDKAKKDRGGQNAQPGSS